MQFAIKYHPQAVRTQEEWNQARTLFMAWNPPSGLEVKHHFHLLSNDGVMILEVSSIEELYAALLPYQPIIDFQVEPVINVVTALAISMDAPSTPSPNML